MKPFAPLFRAVLAASVVALSSGAAMARSPSHHAHGGHAAECSERHRAEVEALIQDYVDISNAQDLSRYPEVFADDYRLVSTVGTFDGLPAYMDLMAAVYDALPDIHYTIDEILVDGDKAVLRYTYTATSLGSFMGLPPSGATFSCSGLEVDRVEDGKLVEVRNFTDYYCLLAGVGAL
jgi:steroid delta-isomerase-like uncharacterized protein